jgi:hypothetical protein
VAARRAILGALQREPDIVGPEPPPALLAWLGGPSSDLARRGVPHGPFMSPVAMAVKWCLARHVAPCWPRRRFDAALSR